MGQIIFPQPGSNRAQMRLLRMVPPGPNQILTHPYLTDCIEVICSSETVCVRDISKKLVNFFQMKSLIGSVVVMSSAIMFHTLAEATENARSLKLARCVERSYTHSVVDEQSRHRLGLSVTGRVAKQDRVDSTVQTLVRQNSHA